MQSFSEYNKTINEGHAEAQAAFGLYMAGDIDLKQLMRDSKGIEIATPKQLEDVLNNKATLKISAEQNNISIDDVKKRISALLKEIS